MSNSTITTIVYVNPYIQLWNTLLDDPIPHEKYMDVFEFNIYQNNFFHVQSLLISVFLLLWIIYRLFSRSTSPSDPTQRIYLQDLHPRSWIVKGNPRSLGILFVILSMVCWLIWGYLGIKVGYYEASGLEWSYLYNNVVVSNGSISQINHIRDALYLLDNGDGQELYRDILEGVPIVQQEDPMDYQKLPDQGGLGRGLRYPHNMVFMENVTLLTNNPSIITNKHMFDRWIPEIYYPNVNYWIETIYFQTFQSISMSLITSSIFLGVASLRSTLTMLNRKTNYPGRTTSILLTVYGLFRLLIFPTIDLLKCDLRTLGIVETQQLPKKESMGGGWGRFTPFDSLEEDQQEMYVSRYSRFDRLRQRDPVLYGKIMEARESVVSEMDTDQMLGSVKVSPWILGIGKQYVSFLERLIVILVLGFMIRSIRRKKQRRIVVEDTASRLVEDLRNFGKDGAGSRKEEHSEGDDMGRLMAQWMLMLGVNCMVLILIPWFHLAEPHSRMILGNPMLQDISGQILWTSEVALVLYMVMVLFPQNNGMTMFSTDGSANEGVFSRDDDDDDVASLSSSSISTLESVSGEEPGVGNESTMGSKTKLKYRAPTEYKFPEWVDQEVEKMGGDREKRRDGSVMSAEVPVQLRISIDPVQDRVVSMHSVSIKK